MVTKMQVAPTAVCTSATTEVTLSSSTVQSNTQIKHSMPFFISPAALFNNKRLKRKQRKRAQNQYKNKNKKTERQPTLTINLLSDEDENNEHGEQNQVGSKFNPIDAYNIEQKQQWWKSQQCLYQQQEMLLKSVNCNEPPPLVPLSNTTPPTFQKHHSNNNSNKITNLQQNMLLYQQQQQQQQYNNYPMVNFMLPHTMSMLHSCDTNKKRRRKRKSNVGQVILNEETIVLSDDEEVKIPHKKLSSNTVLRKSPVLSLLPELTLTAIHNSSNNCNNNNNNISNYNNNHLHGGEEEVTVSLVPRHSANATKVDAHSQSEGNSEQAARIASPSTTGSNSKNSSTYNIFQMFPDETTVHTVIANRTYELSLAKLREGLAQGEQQSLTSAKPSSNCYAANKLSETTPISLKLSSDLSISLISDEEDDCDAAKNELLNNDERARISAETLRRQQPQLSVQQINLSASSSKQPPKRRKLY